MDDNKKRSLLAKAIGIAAIDATMLAATADDVFDVPLINWGGGTGRSGCCG